MTNLTEISPQTPTVGLNSTSSQTAHSTQLKLSLISNGTTSRGKSKYKVLVGKRQIGVIVESAQNCFGASLALQFGNYSVTFSSKDRASYWLVARYLEWFKQPIRVELKQYFYVVRHGDKYIGNIYFSEADQTWIACSDSIHGQFDLKRTRSFDQAKNLIVQAHLS